MSKYKEVLSAGDKEEVKITRLCRQAEMNIDDMLHKKERAVLRCQEKIEILGTCDALKTESWANDMVCAKIDLAEAEAELTLTKEIKTEWF